MSLNESIVEDAALEWFGELGYAIGHGPQIAPGEPAAERDSFGNLVQSRCAPSLTRPLPAGDEQREGLRLLNPTAIQSRTLATLLPKLLSEELQTSAAI